MKRREFLKTSSFFAFLALNQDLYAQEDSNFIKFFGNILFPKKEIIENKKPLKQLSPVDNISSKEKVHKNIYIEESLIPQFNSVRNKLKLIERYVGYGNFNIISFDKMLKIAKYSTKIKNFTQKEIDFLESIFYYDPKYHGFYGQRISKNITDKINKKDIRKIPYTGHYLFKGEPEKTYYKMINDIGDSLILTSGIRSIVKQSKLFLDKLYLVDGNLSLASKSLAPPAFTYHSVSDFDVGKKGFGHANFTSRFALTQEYLKMRKLKYIDMRYTINNKDGVRYEPWHVKII